jgi:peptidoglycan/LPS O-acetylase OafA/YrhL
MGCALILLASLSSRRIQAVLNLSPLVFLGKISYSVYLLQFIIILCLLPPWIHCLNLIGMEKPVWLLPLSLIFSVGVTVGLSALSYRYIETPCIELGQWLSKKRWAICFKKS